MGRATSLVAREHELDRALHSLRFSGGVLITGEAGAGKTFLAARVADQLPQPAGRLADGHRRQPGHPARRAERPAAARPGHHPPGPGRPARQHPAARAQPTEADRPGRPSARAAPPAYGPAGPGRRRRPAPRPAVGGRAAVPGQRQVRSPARHHAGRRDPLGRGDRAVEGAGGRPARPRPARTGPPRARCSSRCSGGRSPRAPPRCCGRAATATPST